jgi:hypothetical protein
MRLLTGPAIAVMLSALSVFSWAQQQHQRIGTASVSKPTVTAEQAQDDGFGMTPDDRLSVIAAALDTKVQLRSGHDCSHLVHTIYERAGFRYAYVPSSDLYRGDDAFQRIKVPEPGDLVVWQGHVGIVIKPSQHLFFSFMRSGPGIDNWEAAYWKKRGRVRFYRYLINSCASCNSTLPAAHPLVRIKQKH